MPRDLDGLRRAVRDGVGIRFRDTGDRQAPPLVFVHGWGCDHRFFAPQADHFSARHRVIAPDQRGFGASDKPERGYAIEDLADDLAWLCAALGLERPVLVGHSMGGAVALALAARHPSLAAGIALCDPAIFLPPWALANREQMLAGLASPGYRDVLRGFVERYLFIPGDDPAQRAWILEAMCGTAQHVLAASMAATYAFDAEAAARACRVPTLCIEAEEPLVGSRRLRDACPQVELASTPGVGHFHPLLAPDETNAILERFVRAPGR